MSRALYLNLLDKSIDSAVAAIEIYNKPAFSYREESFAILMINSWELLLKAEILLDNSGNVRSIYSLKHRINKDGSKSKLKYTVPNISDSPTTIGMQKAMNICIRDERLESNLLTLLAIRDNAVHFTNSRTGFASAVRDIGTASLKSYTVLCDQWFNKKLDNHNLYLMPIGFYDEREFTSVPVEKINAHQSSFYNFLAQKITQFPSDETQTHNVILSMEMNYRKTTKDTTYTYRYDKNSPNTMNLEKRELIKSGLENGTLMDYDSFVSKLRPKIKEFKKGKIFNAINNEIKKDLTLVEPYPRSIATNSDFQYFYKQQAIQKAVDMYRKVEDD